MIEAEEKMPEIGELEVAVVVGANEPLVFIAIVLTDML